MPTEKASRRQVLQTLAVGAAFLVASPSFGQEPVKEPELTWHDAQECGVEGKGWSDTGKYFDRLPARAEGVVPNPVWNLSRQSAGLLVRFATDAEEIWADHVVTSNTLARPNISAIAMSGLDLYGKDPAGEWRWVGVTRPTTQQTKQAIITGLAPGMREYQLYLPLYNGTESLKIGVPSSAKWKALAPREEKPIVFYGTSITQGASASRAGMPHPAILGRRLDRPVINLGFSGNGRMEKEVGQFLCELDPAVFVIDCLPNMHASQVKERAAPLVRQLRAARPDVPVVLVEDRTYANAPFLPATQKRLADSRKAFQEAYRTLKAEGVEKLWYLPGETLLGEDREDTADGSHPNDLGFWRQANAFEPVLKEALKASK